jgi:hypothetical protein
MMMSSKKQAKWGDVSMSRYDPETVCVFCRLGFHTQATVGELVFKLLVGHLVESPVEITLDRALHRSRVHNPHFGRGIG